MSRQIPNVLAAMCILDLRVQAAGVIRQSFGLTGEVQQTSTQFAFVMQEPVGAGPTPTPFLRLGQSDILRLEPAAIAATPNDLATVLFVFGNPTTTRVCNIFARSFAGVTSWPFGVWQVQIWRGPPLIGSVQ